MDKLRGMGFKSRRGREQMETKPPLVHTEAVCIVVLILIKYYREDDLLTRKRKKKREK